MTDEIARRINQLPDDVRAHLLEYIEFLSKKYTSKSKRQGKLRFDWEGGLAELRDQYTSVELQHKASEWR